MIQYFGPRSVIYLLNLYSEFNTACCITQHHRHVPEYCGGSRYHQDQRKRTWTDAVQANNARMHGVYSGYHHVTKKDPALPRKLYDESQGQHREN